MKTIILATFIATLGFGAANATIINISATASGEQTGGANCTNACEGALITPVQVNFTPGVYHIYDAYSPTTGLETGASYDAWSFSGAYQSWVWHWKALLDDGQDGATINKNNYNSYILLDVDAPNPQDAFYSEAAAASFGASTPYSTLSFSQPTTVDFVVNDYYLSDNTGGVSLDIERVSPPPSATPEPATWAMLLLGVGAIGSRLRRRRPGALLAA